MHDKPQRSSFYYGKYFVFKYDSYEQKQYKKNNNEKNAKKNKQTLHEQKKDYI